MSQNTLNPDVLLASLRDTKLAARIAAQQALSLEDIAGGDFTSLARLAAARRNGELLFPQLATDWHTHTGLRGLPIALSFPASSSYISLRPNQLLALGHLLRWEAPTLQGHPSFFTDKEKSVHPLRVSGPILKMEMGLGKTLTAICWSLLAPRRSEYPTLVVASKTVMGVWKRDGFEKFGIGSSVLYYHRDYISREEIEGLTHAQLKEYDFVVTTYDMVVYAAPKEMKQRRPKLPVLDPAEITNSAVSGRALFFHTPWERVIADESQRFANPSTHIYKAMMCVFGYSKVCLTGTPVRNYCTDLWAQLRFCGYTATMKKSVWKQSFPTIIKRDRILDLILDQGYDDTDITLPEKRYHRIHITLTGMHKKIYDYTLACAREAYDEMLSSKVNTMSVLKLFLLLRIVCIAPYLLTDESRRAKDDVRAEHCRATKVAPELYLEQGEYWQWLRPAEGEGGTRCAKVAKVVSIIEEIPSDEKVIVFSMFTCSLDLVRVAIKAAGLDLDIYQIDGDVPATERQETLALLQNDKQARVLLMTYKTGGEGINATWANHVIELDPWWTDSVRLQAEARAWRSGQQRIVHVYMLYIKQSIEEHVLKICDMKNEMIAAIFGTALQGGHGVTMEMLGYLLGCDTALPAPKQLRRGNKRDQAALRAARLRYYEKEDSDVA